MYQYPYRLHYQGDQGPEGSLGPSSVYHMTNQSYPNLNVPHIHPSDLRPLQRRVGSPPSTRRVGSTPAFTQPHSRHPPPDLLPLQRRVGPEVVREETVGGGVPPEAADRYRVKAVSYM